MTDFLDRYGEQLARARGRRRRRVGRAVLLAIAVPAVVAVVLLVARPTPDIEHPAQAPVASPVPTATPAPTEPAAAGTWTPTLGRPKLDITASIDHTPVAQPVVDALGVLRRPQSDRDRELAGPKLSHAGNGVDGIQVDGVRALDENYALVPVMTFASDPGVGAGICLMGGGGSVCAPIDSVPKHGVTSISGGKTGTRYVGIVPDGIFRVRFIPERGPPIEAPVIQNFYELRYDATAPTTRIAPPKGYNGPVGDDGKIDGPPMPARGTLEWLDASGSIVRQG
jgi:hypothetical protein